MPIVTLKNGEIRRFPYSSKGVADAKKFANSTGGSLKMEKQDMGRTLARTYSKSKKSKGGRYA